MSYQLFNYKEDGSSFQPEQEQLDNLKVGQWAKIGMSYEKILFSEIPNFPLPDKPYPESISSETFHVRVLFVDGDDIIGRIENDLFCGHKFNIKWGDPIRFKKDNINSIRTQEEYNNYK